MMVSSRPWQKGAIWHAMGRVFLLLAILLLLPGQPQAASLTLSLKTVAGEAGANVNVPIFISDAQGMGALEMELVYDPSVLEFKTIEQGAVLAGLFDFNLIGLGRVKIALASSEETEGRGVLMTAVFKVLTDGRSQLAIEKAAAWDRANSGEMAVSTHSGQFTARTAQAIDGWLGLNWGWIVAGLLLLVNLALLVFVFMIRSRVGVMPAALSSSTFANDEGQLQLSLRLTLVVTNQGVVDVRCARCGHSLAAGRAVADAGPVQPAPP